MKLSITLRILASACLALALAAPGAQASWVWWPLDIRLVQADLVVVGRIVEVDRPWIRFSRYTAVGEIEISQVLKGPRDLERAQLAWGEPGIFSDRLSNDDFLFHEGQEGVWILVGSEGSYACPTPGHIRRLESVDNVRAMLDSLRAIPAGAPDAGIALSLAFQTGDGVTASRDVPSLGTSLVAKTGAALLHAWITNVSDQPVLVPRRAAGHLQLTLRGENGEPLDLGNGAYDPGSGGSAASEFDILHPGDHRFVDQLPLRTEVPGELSITGVFAHDAGNRASEPRTWHGSASRTLSFTVPAPRVPDEIAGIKLLPGYTLTPRFPDGGGDPVGVISAPGRLEIRYGVTRVPEGLATAGEFWDQIEIMQSVYADPPFEWTREQTVAGEPVRLALTSEAHEQRHSGDQRTLMAYYPSRGLNLSVAVENDEQIDEALSMMLAVPGS